MSSRNENLKEEALNRTRWRIRFGKGYGLIVRQKNNDDDDDFGRSLVGHLQYP
jgi:hypothetical protein